MLDMGACLGESHIVACIDSNSELGYGEEVQDVGRVGVGLELAAGGAVRGVLGVILIVVILVHPALEEAEFVLCGIQAAPVGVECLQGHHVLVRDDTVQAAAIDDVDGDRARDRTETGDVGRPSANAGDQEGEEHLERETVYECSGVGGAEW